MLRPPPSVKNAGRCRLGSPPRWRSTTEAANQGENGQHPQESAEDEAEAWCSYYGRALEDAVGGAEDKHIRGPVPCPHRRVCARPLHVGASGMPRERSCRPEVLRRVPLRVAGEADRSHPAELGRGLPMTELGGKAALTTTMQFAVQRCSGPASRGSF